MLFGTGRNHFAALVHDQSAGTARSDIDPEELDISSCRAARHSAAELAEIFREFR